MRYFTARTLHSVYGSEMFEIHAHPTYSGEDIRRNVDEGAPLVRTAYYATEDRLGCGKTCATADGAVRELIHNNGRKLVELTEACR